MGLSLLKFTLGDFLLGHMTYGKPGGLYIEGPTFVVLTVLIALAWVFGYSLVWVYRDAEKRGKNPFVAMLFILLTGWPGSFIWWFWIRPPVQQENTRRSVVLPPVPAH